MNEELHNIPIEPELEARIVALVLGEASDFEAEELNRLVARRPELAAFKLQMEQIHGSLKHVSSGELESPEAEWRLPAERRSAVMAAIRGEAAQRADATPAPRHVPHVPMISLAKRRWKRSLAAFLSTSCVAGLFAAYSLYSFQSREQTTSEYFAEANKVVDFSGGTTDAYRRNVFALDGNGDAIRSHEDNGMAVTANGSDATESPRPVIALTDNMIGSTNGQSDGNPGSSVIKNFYGRGPALSAGASGGKQRTSSALFALQSTLNAGDASIQPTDVVESAAAIKLRGEVNVQAMQDLGVVILKGNEADVSKVESIIADLEASSNLSVQGNTIASAPESTLTSPEPAMAGLVTAPAKMNGGDGIQITTPGGASDLLITSNSATTNIDGIGTGGNASPAEGRKGFAELGSDKTPSANLDAPASGVQILSQENASMGNPIVRSLQVPGGGVAGGAGSGGAAGGPGLPGVATGGAGGGPGGGGGRLSRGGDLGGASSPQSEDEAKRLGGARNESGSVSDTAETLEQFVPGSPSESRVLAESDRQDGAMGGTGQQDESRELRDRILLEKAKLKEQIELSESLRERKQDNLLRATMDADENSDALADSPSKKDSEKDNKSSTSDGTSSTLMLEHLSTEAESNKPAEPKNEAEGKQRDVYMGHRFQTIDDFGLPESKMPEGARSSEDTVTRSNRISVTEPEADIRKGGADKSHPEEPSVVKDMPDDAVLQLQQAENSPAKPAPVSGKAGVVLSRSGSDGEGVEDLQKSVEEWEIVARNEIHSDGKPSRAARPSLGRVSNHERKATSSPVAPPAGLSESNAAAEAFSTFSLHVSDVSFKLASAALAKGEWPEASKIRIEEFVNAFDYGDPLPGKNERVACAVEQGIHPFLQQRNVLRVSMRTSAEGRAANTPLHLTFVLDNSGSMERADRQATVRKAFTLLSQQLTAIDQVTLISFSRQPRLLAENISGTEAGKLVQLVEQLPSEGGTNIEAALQLAFEKASTQNTSGAQNRIVLLTDGAVNLGNANPESLSRMVESMRESGIAFDAAGISADGLNDEVLEALTRKGDGRYYLMDSQEDADDSFVQQIAGALRPSASNVKVQVEFNPKRVGQYKLLGFEKHLLKQEDFRNDAVDAAEMAAAEAGVAVYQFEAKPDGEGDVGSVSVRFRDLSTGEMVEHRWPIPYEPDAARPDQATPSLRIATTAAMLAAKLKGEALGETVDLQTLSRLIDGIPQHMQSNLRIQQLKAMIEQARQLEER